MVKKHFTPMKALKFIVLGLLLSASFGHAQRGQISIEQDPGISDLMKLYEKNISDTEFYTIQVGFGRYEEAQELKEAVDLDFPQWKARIVFDSPTYRVQVGRFQKRLEAEREFLEVRKKYPGALLLKPVKRTVREKEEER